MMKRKTEKDVLCMGLIIPAGTEFPLAEWRSPPKKPGEKADFDLFEIMCWGMNEEVLFFPHNRGTGHESETTTKSCRKGLLVDVIGECTVGWYADKNVYGDDKERLHFNSFHSRLKGFFQRLLDGEMTKKEGAASTSVRVSNDFLTAYQYMGYAGSQHRTKDRIWCPDLAFGAPLRRLSQAVGPGVKKRFKKFSTAFSALIFTLDKENKGEYVDWDWAAVYPSRTQAAKLSNERAGAVTISAIQMQNLVLAVQFWYDFIVTLEKLAGNVNVKKIIGSAGLFGFIVTDHYAKMGLCPHDYETGTERLLNSIFEVLNLVPDLCRGNQAELDKAVKDLKAILRKRVVKKKAS